MLCVCLHFACLVTFSWMASQQAIQRLRSGFHEPETLHAHAGMLWHGWFHPSTVDRSVWLAFMFLRLSLRCSIPGEHSSTRKLVHMPSEVFEPFCLLQCLHLPRLEAVFVNTLKIRRVAYGYTFLRVEYREYAINTSKYAYAVSVHCSLSKKSCKKCLFVVN